LQSDPIEAYFSSSTYQLVAEYEAPSPIKCQDECSLNTLENTNALIIANKLPGYILADDVFLDQEYKDFGIENLYTIRFKPANSIPNVGWIKIVYPTTVLIKDEVAFVESCEAVTSAPYKGEEYCKLIFESRTIWIYQAFMDQTSYTSEIAVSFIMTNPNTNKEKDTSKMTAEEKT
jgi:hypothetical protein